MTERDPPLELEEDDDFLMALPWLPEREPSMLLPEGAAPNDNFDALLNQWLMSAMQQGDGGRGLAPMEGTTPSLAPPAFPLPELEPLPLGGGGAMAPADDPFNQRLSTLMLGPAPPPSTSHATQRSWEDIPLFNPQFASAQAATGSPDYSQPLQSASREAGSLSSGMNSDGGNSGSRGSHEGGPQGMRSSRSASGGPHAQLSITSSMLHAAVSTAHNITSPIGSLATSIGEGGKGLLQMPVDAAKTGARMGSGLIMGAMDGGMDGARRAWRRRNQSEESRQKERARNRRAQKRFREKQKARQLERQDTVLGLRAQLDAMTGEKAALASRNAILEKVFTMRAHLDASADSTRHVGQMDFSDVYAGEDTPQSITLSLTTGQLTLTRDQLSSLSWTSHTAIWKDYVEQLAAELEATKHTGGDEASDRMLDLIQECSTLSLSLCVINPMSMLRFQTTRLDQPAEPGLLGEAEKPPPPSCSPKSHWAKIEEQLDLSQEQRVHAFEVRHVFLSQLGDLLRQRAELHKLATHASRAMKVDLLSGRGVADEYRSLLEAMELIGKLQRNLQEEQKLIVQRMIVGQQCNFRPRQVAISLVGAWPWYPDTMALIEAAATRSVLVRTHEDSWSSTKAFDQNLGELQTSSRPSPSLGSFASFGFPYRSSACCKGGWGTRHADALDEMYELLSHNLHGYSQQPQPQQQQQRTRKPSKVSIVFRQTDGLQHSGSVNAVALSEDGGQLFTGSRDTTVKRWNVAECTSSEGRQQQGDFQAPRQQSEAEAECWGHCDWVNDAVLLGSSAWLATCSSDRSIRLWDTQASGRIPSGATFSRHKDYVMSLAVAGSPTSPLLASAGLGAEVYLWDVAAASSSNQAPLQAQGFKGSVYTVAMDAMGTILAAGTPDGAVRVCDPRTGAKVCKLRGHTDGVRSLRVNAEGTMCLSGSSDHTMRLWDLGQQRCLQTFACHTDSVWTLQVSDAFSVVVSGGRDGAAYRTDMATATSELLFTDQHAIHSLAWDRQRHLLWAGTTASTVKGWHMPPPTAVGPSQWASPRSPTAGAAVPSPGSQTAEGARDEMRDTAMLDEQDSPAEGRAFVCATAAFMRSRQTFGSGLPSPQPLQRAPRAILRGISPLVRCTVLQDKQHVLTQALDGTLAKWDVTMGTVAESLGAGGDFEEMERRLFRPMAVHAWFSADCKLGSLAMHMESSSCFHAEVYGRDLGFADMEEDKKINYGEHVLKAAFINYMKAAEYKYVTQGGQQAAAEAAAHYSPYFDFTEGASPLVMSERDDPSTGERRPWCLPVSELGNAPSASVPRWVEDAVLRSHYKSFPDLKYTFSVLPAEGSHLPSMLHSRRNAPRIIRARKVAVFVQDWLASKSIEVNLAPIFYEQSLPHSASGTHTPEENGGSGHIRTGAW
ncbi:hypothetical protein WJX73_001306 [Symbiochloris irregularis]|uniref:BZIP domain-containing protein n=1 Tax=Symbiochloris irregularis TaxID=706552 RepID=A0AAW1NYA8_9CHLO